MVKLLVQIDLENIGFFMRFSLYKFLNDSYSIFYDVSNRHLSHRKVNFLFIYDDEVNLIFVFF